LLLKLIRHGRPKRRGKPVPPEPDPRPGYAAAYAAILELDGVQTKNAISDACALYGVSRSSLYAAKRGTGTSDAEFQSLVAKWEADPEERKNQRRMHENIGPYLKEWVPETNRLLQGKRARNSSKRRTRQAKKEWQVPLKSSN